MRPGGIVGAPAQREITQARAENPGVLADHAGQPEKNYSNQNNSPIGGTNAAYLTARIAATGPTF